MIQRFQSIVESSKTVPKLVVQGQWIVKDDFRFNSSDQLQPIWTTSAMQYSKLQ